MSEDFEEEYEENFEPDAYEEDVEDTELTKKITYTCVICGNEFETENELDYHARVHNILSVEFR